MESARFDEGNGDLVANLAWVRRLAFAIVRDDALADDVAQDVAFQALRHSAEERPGSLTALRAWLATAARRLAIDRARAERSRRARERAVSRPEADGGSTDAVLRGERSRRVVDAVMHLAEPYRSAILLRYMDELPMAEVAARLGASETTVRKRLTKGLELLRSRLEDELGEDSRTWALALLGMPGRDAAAIATPALGLTAIVHGVLLMNAKWIAAGIAVVVLGLAAWLVASEPDETTGALARGTRASAELITSTTEPAPDAGRNAAESAQSVAPSTAPNVATGPFVTVRSSIGLPLPFVDVQDELEDWQRAELYHDRCALDPVIALPRLLRAPGHVPKLVTRFGEELVLEPDMLLSLEAEGLRTRTRSIRIDDRWSHGERPPMPEMRQAVAYGFLSDDMWCAAVSHDLVRAAVFRDELDVTILWPDHQRADLHVRVAPGVRAAWTVPVDRGARGAPLRLHVRRPAEEPPGEVALTVTLPHEGEEVVSETFAWGRIAIYDPRTLWLDAQKLEAGSSDYTFDFLPTGVPLLLGGHDRTTCAYGRMSFVHDGTDRTLELRPAFVLRGALLSAADRTPVGSANFTWEFRDETDTKYYWRCEKYPLRTDLAGRFEARGPMQLTLADDMVLDRPSRLVIEIEAPGFERFERAVDTAGAHAFDCDELLLTPRAAELTLAPGHGVTPEALAWMTLRVSSIPDVYWEVRGSALNADGSMLVSLLEAEGSTRDRRLLKGRRLGPGEDVRLPWPREPGRWVMIHMLLGDRDETRLFERRADGKYAPVPRREVELDLKLGATPGGRDTWQLGWQLDEQWGCFGVDVPRVAGESSRVRFSVPVGASLWWSPQQTPPGLYGAPADVGGSMPIDSVPERFVLR